jgi:hypothetical protein
LYLFVLGPKGEKFGDKGQWHQILVQTLAPNAAPVGDAILFEKGDRDWHQRLPAAPVVPQTPATPPQRLISFASGENVRRRGLEHIAPSRREGKGLVPLGRLFHPSPGTGTVAGTIYHAWFESIEWLDDGDPTDAALQAIAQNLSADLPLKSLDDMDRLLANFRVWLEKPAIRLVLLRSNYVSRAGYGDSAPPITPRVERERRFMVIDNGKFLNGSLDRIVWHYKGERIIAADVLDFKTDHIQPTDEAALAARTEHYRPQMEIYRQAVARMANLPPERIATRLVFTNAERVVDV